MTTVTAPGVDLEQFNDQGYLVVEDVLDVEGSSIRSSPSMWRW